MFGYFGPAELESDKIFSILEVTSNLFEKKLEKGRNGYIKMTKYVDFALSDLVLFPFI